MQHSSGRPDLIIAGIYNDRVCDDVICSAVVLEEEDGEADGEEERQRKVLDCRADEGAETHLYPCWQE